MQQYNASDRIVNESSEVVFMNAADFEETRVIETLKTESQGFVLFGHQAPNFVLPTNHSTMADTEVTDPQLAAELKKKRTFRTFSYRGIELEKLLDMSNDDVGSYILISVLHALIKNAPPNEKPTVVKTHLRDMIIVPEMIGSVVGIYNGKVFNSVEIKPEMTGHYLAEFSISYKPVKHGRPGIGATHCAKYIGPQLLHPAQKILLFNVFDTSHHLPWYPKYRGISETE
ncbi:2299_t:CDS:2, partial [Acaulospora colombiana]